MREEEVIILKRRFQSFLPKYGALWTSMAKREEPSLLSAIEKKESIQINLLACDENYCSMIGCQSCEPPTYEEIVEEKSESYFSEETPPYEKESIKENVDVNSIRKITSDESQIDLVGAMAKVTINDEDDLVGTPSPKHLFLKSPRIPDTGIGYETGDSWIDEHDFEAESQDELWTTPSATRSTNNHLIIIDSDTDSDINGTNKDEPHDENDITTKLIKEDDRDESESDEDLWDIPTVRPTNVTIIMDSDSENENENITSKHPNSASNYTKSKRNNNQIPNEIIILSDDDSDYDDSSDPKRLFSQSEIRTTTKGTPTSRSFKKNRGALTKKVFNEFNERVFYRKLGSVDVRWTNKLRTTAGITRLKQRSAPGEEIQRIASIELNTKVIDEYQRLRSTLLHEMCHAAQWLIDSNVKPHHGRIFKKWANLAMNAIHDVTVTTTHDYEIQFKYAWACQTEKCGAIIKRQSRSVDPSKQCCGRCKGRLEEINVPRKGESSIDRTPKKRGQISSYNMFIKQNSAHVRARLQLLKTEKITQSEVMKECARLWRSQKET
mmetsp:Transcript_15942/g.24433  ORF Transcript_15942/g.24433 Transcript_15942/m.24433 type:complete len:552 (+) Transcript_15942:140-1795(+)